MGRGPCPRLHSGHGDACLALAAPMYQGAWLSCSPHRFVICDEAHALKSRDTHRTAFVSQLVK